MTNSDVIREFFNSEGAKNANLRSITATTDARYGEFKLEGATALYSYNTIIAVAYKKILFVNTTKYSVTTSKHQNYVLNYGDAKFRHILEVKDINWDVGVKKLFENSAYYSIEQIKEAKEKLTKATTKLKTVKILEVIKQLETRLEFILSLAVRYGIPKEDLEYIWEEAKNY